MNCSTHLFFFFFTISISCSNGTQLIIENKCKQSIWPALLGTSGQPTPKNGGFPLFCGQQVIINVPERWSGRIWARQGCRFDEHGRGSCQTGDCGGLLTCRGIGGTPPATLVEMTLGTSSNPLHYYDISLVDGFNLPVSMRPVGGGKGCRVAACESDVNAWCPMRLMTRKEGVVVGCKSACLAFRDPRYCCTGEFSKANVCKPTVYSHLFKALCPRAYSYPYDEASGLKTCRASRYVITFCPSK
ncbi:hypothetical protein Leryth_015102 [Lithospermum erythrorhizon]|uniref:Thaumatin-like protein n=1 Tax=Lithospermum erythrorhizon TaxID=34254 RepID=A0AAV3PBI5_LITER|nr:hypothetical protein Leryth_015102 [Lithospermum erythrorhizon]